MITTIEVNPPGGWIRLVDVMGTDKAIVDAARISYGKGTKTVSSDRALLRYLMRHSHTTPFEMCELKFMLHVPMDCWRQWVRHRTANINEYSTRYSEAIDEFATTEPNMWRQQATNNKQGSEGMLPFGLGLSEEEKEFHGHARAVYKKRLSCGVTREQARKDLPISTFTEAYWKIDLHNLLHFLKVRLDDHAQFEIRCYAQTIASLVKEHFPITWEAFEDYRLNAVVLTALDQSVILEYMRTFAPIDEILEEKIRNKREKKECKSKLLKLGIIKEK